MARRCVPHPPHSTLLLLFGEPANSWIVGKPEVMGGIWWSRTCALARRYADGLRAAGFEVLNEVVINQLPVSFGMAERTQEVIREQPERFFT